MKTLENLNNVDKAKLLFQLFPQEIPAILDFIEGMCASVKENEKTNREKWDNGFLDFDYYLSLINAVQATIKKYGKRLSSNGRLFGDQLFDGMLAIFTNHCIHTYTTVRQHPNRKFTVAVDLLFNP